MSLFVRGLVAWIARLPEAFADWTDRYVMRAHEGTRLADGWVCLRCSKRSDATPAEWPCAEWLAASGRIGDRPR